MKTERRLLPDLKSLLRVAGVQFRRVPDATVIAALAKHKRLDTLSRLLVAFLRHFKGGSHTVASVGQAARARGLLDGRLAAFLKVFEPVLEHYQAGLAERSTIDFTDMILRASEHLESGRYRSPYTCILVDEFQDIAADRARLLRALARQVPGTRLFCVGDDWQGINRFAGSDIAFLRDFAEHFGPAETIFLDRSFRFNDRISAVAARFILANPAQVEKIVATARTVDTSRVFVHLYRDAADALAAALGEIAADSPPWVTAEVLLLGRYARLEKTLDLRALSARFPKLKLRFSTVHQAKGAEADYVVVLDVNSGLFGFPPGFADDPLLDTVLAQPEPFPYAEERRLFYVALTRARFAVHILAPADAPSPFIEEIRRYTDHVQTRTAARGAASTQPQPLQPCPVCRTGVMAPYAGTYGPILVCSNFASGRCSHTTNIT